MAEQLILTNNQYGIKFKGVDMNCGIAITTTKAKATVIAKRIGQPVNSVQRGHNNLFAFWFIGQQQGELYRVWRTDGAWVDFPFDHSGTLSRTL
jgi:hypothetical protein